ncbi:hypothetical protein PV10_01755 [Exophiala mesophila]|uniref:Atos-like conserved domain-containing protein n=1 Tax=Exophiala mesophila TaxID=212818 RepID=A0A0D1X823_EXOME|nr:uncharacterized protein PV10_01755 [Exophiala mesophila]KIV98065.1 hypothetical protein PV10_01755 [Exophiala mesophila]
MPFVFGPEPLPSHPSKRRKLSHPHLAMARYEERHNSDPQDAETGKDRSVNTDDWCDNPSPGDTKDEPEIRTSDREELIQCIKRGQRPTWVPKPTLEALCTEANTWQPRSTGLLHSHDSESQPISPYPVAQRHESSTPEQQTSPCATDSLRRSLSALHTGDFHNAYQPISSPTTFDPPMNISPPIMRHDYSSQYGFPPMSKNLTEEPPRRSRAPSLGSSLSSSFVMRVPTSPLVNSMNNPSLDFSPKEPSSTDTKAARRRTLPPNAYGPLQVLPIEDSMPPFGRHSSATHQLNSLETHDIHTPRRSLSSFTYQPTSSNQPPSLARARRLSLACDVSPRQRASLVGSFEESILRGRMSIPPSKPLDFVAQIGVVGKGKCPASLKCPAHVTVPFPAVFYNYPSSNDSRSISDDNPSPYVGAIDLEHNLKPAEPHVRRRGRASISLHTESPATDIKTLDNPHTGSQDSPSSEQSVSQHVKVPNGGVYRVPQVGQLQVIIKNPNKTAVKLFLVPYDLTGMPPGTKTFVRQRSFSTSPALNVALLDKRIVTPLRERNGGKDILRYLIHLKFCCTSKGRFYLHDQIRVIFANRVPDDKEKLRHEVQLQEPRFSPYKPTVENGSRSPSMNENRFSPSPTMSPPPYGARGPILDSGRGNFDNFYDSALTFNPPTNPALVARGPDLSADLSPTSSQRDAYAEGNLPPTPGFLPSRSSRSSPVSWTTTAKGAPSIEAGNGLISQKLREFNANRAAGD